MRLDEESIRDVVRAVADEQFGTAQIVEVSVSGNTDEDGEPILDVRIVFDAKDDRLDKGRLSGFIRRLRARLTEMRSAIPGAFVHLPPGLGRARPCCRMTC